MWDCANTGTGTQNTHWGGHRVIIEFVLSTLSDTTGWYSPHLAGQRLLHYQDDSGYSPPTEGGLLFEQG